MQWNRHHQGSIFGNYFLRLQSPIPASRPSHLQSQPKSETPVTGHHSVKPYTLSAGLWTWISHLHDDFSHEPAMETRVKNSCNWGLEEGPTEGPISSSTPQTTLALHHELVTFAPVLEVQKCRFRSSRTIAETVPTPRRPSSQKPPQSQFHRLANSPNCRESRLMARPSTSSRSRSSQTGRAAEHNLGM